LSFSPEPFGQGQTRSDCLKYDEVYLHEYNSINEARNRIGLFINTYNSIRPHQSLGGKTPDTVYYSEIDNTLSA